MGAHVLRAGVARHLIDLMERGLVDHVAMNGAGPIHDWEFALIGASTESVARYIQTGEFGLWTETGRMNDVIRDGARDGLGLGEAIGRAILDGPFPHKDVSVLAAAARLGVPATVHVGVGYDILHEHPNCDGAALGATSYRDFLVFTQTVTAPGGRRAAQLRLRGHGAGSLPQGAGDGPQRRPPGGPRRSSNFTTAVFDLVPLDGDTRRQAPKTDPRYYYRPWKTILVRTVADGGESFYVQGDHRATVPHLRRAALAAEGGAV